MGRIYRNQSSLKITARTYINLSGSDECMIKYRKPDGAEGSFPAAVQDPGEGIVSYEIKSGDIDVSGWWIFWVSVVFIDGRTAPGRMSRVFVWDEGKG